MSKNNAKTKVAPVGHNSGVSGERIKAFIERIETLEDEKSLAAENIKDVYAEAKSAGFDAKVLKRIVSLRKRTAEKNREEQELLELYASAAQLDLGF